MLSPLKGAAGATTLEPRAAAAVMPPLVSAIIPVHDGEPWVGEALRSVADQDHRPLEVIVVDDGSSDGSAAIARSFPGVRYLRQQNAGVAAARNAGIEAASGDFIAFLDQDDRWLPTKVTCQLARLLERPDLGFVLAHERTFLAAGTAPPPWLPPDAIGHDRPSLVPGVLFVRRALFGTVGLFDPTYVAGSDCDWMYRAKDAGVPFEILPQALLLKRVHAHNASHDRRLCKHEAFRALRSSVLRQRSRRALGIANDADGGSDEG